MQSRHQSLAVLTKTQGMVLLSEVLMVVIVQDSIEFKTVLSWAPNLSPLCGACLCRPYCGCLMPTPAPAGCWCKWACKWLPSIRR